MNKNRAMDLLMNVLNDEFEELQENENCKAWACERFGISEEEYEEIFNHSNKEILFMVEESGNGRHEGMFTTSFGLYDDLQSALRRYEEERQLVLTGDAFFLKPEIDSGNYTESKLISSNGNELPCLSIETDWENYELYICEVEKG